MTERRLGKIETVRFGVGGYQEGQLGLHLSFVSGSIGVGCSETTWDAQRITQTEHSQWTEEDRSIQYDEIMRFVSKTLDEAKVDYVHELKDKPVELIFENNTLKSWRILTECL